jgi:hypothetical protein
MDSYGPVVYTVINFLDTLSDYEVLMDGLFRGVRYVKTRKAMYV